MIAFAQARRIVFGLALTSFVLSFVHRTAPAAIAGELTAAFLIGSTALGALAASYFYVYAVLQIPVGVLADTLGPRKLLTAGSAIVGLGSLLFALAPVWEVAAAARTLVGIGAAVAFIAILKVSALWFAPQRFAMLVGVTMFAGNLGAVLAGAPLAWVVTTTSWRNVFLALAAFSALLALATWRRVRDRPEELGYAPIHAHPAPDSRVNWQHALRRVLASPATWPPFFVNFGVAGSFLAFAGLWAVPFLQDTRGLSRVDAAQHASLMLLGVAIGALCTGLIADRLGRRLVMRVFVLLYALSWAPWLAHVQWPQWATLLWFLLMGLVIPGFTLSLTLVKEANPPEHSGIATSVVNTGIFLGAGILQPLIGWVLDHARATGASDSAWDRAILLLASCAVFSVLMTLLASGRKHV